MSGWLAPLAYEGGMYEEKSSWSLQVQLAHGDQNAGQEVKREALELVGGFMVLTHAGLTRAGFLAFYSQ